MGHKQATRARAIGDALHRLGLPRRLIQLIRDGQLELKLKEAYQQLDALNDRLDAWVAANPSLAVKTP